MRYDGQARLKLPPIEAKVLVFTDLPDLEMRQVPAMRARSKALPENGHVNGRQQRSGEIAAIISRFDAGYYAHEYPDVDFQRLDPIMHFIEIGWYEGRNPNAFFDTVSYLLAYPDVEKANINPYYHYLAVGAAEGRRGASSVTPSIRARLLFGRTVADWVSRISPHVDRDFYRKQLRQPFPERTNLAAHYAFRGWREGKRPNPEFDPASVEREEVLNRYLVNPLLIQLEADEHGAASINAPTAEPFVARQSSIESAGEVVIESDAIADQGTDRPDNRRLACIEHRRVVHRIDGDVGSVGRRRECAAAAAAGRVHLAAGGATRLVPGAEGDRIADDAAEVRIRLEVQAGIAVGAQQQRRIVCDSPHRRPARPVVEAVEPAPVRGVRCGQRYAGHRPAVGVGDVVELAHRRSEVDEARNQRADSANRSAGVFILGRQHWRRSGIRDR